MRPFQDWNRADINARIAQNREESRRLGDAADARMAEADGIGGDDMESLKRKIPLVAQARELLEQKTALAKEVQEMNFELHIRDTPELTQEFGPGAD